MSVWLLQHQRLVRKMNTRLASITPNAEGFILYCARVSSDQSNESTGLIKYLIKHKHWSPFEMAHAVMEIQTSRIIAVQLLRHRSFSFQEASQRYVGAAGSFELVKGRRQAEKNRQSSIDDLSEENLDWFDEAQRAVWNFATNLYTQARGRDIARESARFLLPGSARTKLYMAGSIRSWIHYIELRCGEDVQEEHRVIAMQIKKILTKELPVIAEAMEWDTSQPT
jgi:thymidylate synthase (FAD)